MIGGKPATLRLDTQGDQADPRIGVQAAQKLVDEGAVAIVGPYNSGVALPSEAVYRTTGIPILTIATNPAVTAQGNTDVFRLDANDAQLGGDMAIFAAQMLKAKTAAVIDDRTAYGQGVAQEFEKAASARGIQVVDEEYTNDKGTDFGAILTTIKPKRPDVIFYGGEAGQAGPLVKQMHKLAINAKVLGGDGICTPYLGDLAGPDAVTVFCSRGTTDLQKSAAVVDFSARYTARFGAPPQDYAINFYDAVLIVGNALRQADTTAPPSLVKTLKSSHFAEIATNYSWDANGNLNHAPSSIYTFQDGKMKAVP